MQTATAHDFQPQRVWSENERKKIAQLLMRLFDRWDLDTRMQLLLLGLSPSSRAMLTRYRTGHTALSPTQDSLSRAAYLLAIHQSLRTLYPHNEALCYSWIHRRNKALNNATPLQVMEEHGILGIANIAHYLEYQKVH